MIAGLSVLLEVSGVTQNAFRVCNLSAMAHSSFHSLHSQAEGVFFPGIAGKTPLRVTCTVAFPSLCSAVSFFSVHFHPL